MRETWKMSIRISIGFVVLGVIALIMKQNILYSYGYILIGILFAGLAYIMNVRGWNKEKPKKTPLKRAKKESIDSVDSSSADSIESNKV